LPGGSKFIVINGVVVCEVNTAGFILWRAEGTTDGDSALTGVGGYSDTSGSDSLDSVGIDPTSGDEMNPSDPEYRESSEGGMDPGDLGEDLGGGGNDDRSEGSGNDGGGCDFGAFHIWANGNCP
jgi:hypothetical protein